MIKNLDGVELQNFISKFEISGYFPPTVFTSLIDLNTYAICIGSPWIQIPDKMTREDVHKKWTKKEFIAIKQKIKSKTGKAEYTVSFNKTWSCTCSGFKFKRNCSHIGEAKEKLKGKLCIQ